MTDFSYKPMITALSYEKEDDNFQLTVKIGTERTFVSKVPFSFTLDEAKDRFKINAFEHCSDLPVEKLVTIYMFINGLEE